MMSDLQLTRLSTEALLADWRGAWDELASSAEGVSLFQTPLWILNYRLQRRRAGRQLEWLVGANDQLVGLVPLVCDSGLVGQIWPTLRAVHSSGEYESDWVCRPGWEAPFASKVLEHLLCRRYGWYQLQMKAVSEDSTILSAVRAECLARGLRLSESSSHAIPYVRTDSTSAEKSELPSPKYRRELRRRLRGLEKHGEVRFEVIRQAGRELDRALDEFLQVEGSGWKGRSGGAIRCREETRQFWSSLADEAARAHVLRLHLIRVDGRVVSGQLGVVWGARYHCLKVGYDEGFQQFGPGALLTMHALDHCISDPAIDIYDFAGQARPYMRNWTKESRGTRKLVVTPTPIGAGLQHCTTGLRRTLRPVKAMVNRIRSASWPESGVRGLRPSTSDEDRRD